MITTVKWCTLQCHKKRRGGEGKKKSSTINQLCTRHTSQERWSISTTHKHFPSVMQILPWLIPFQPAHTSYTSSQPYSSSTWHFVLWTLNYFSRFKIILFMQHNFNNTFTCWGEKSVYIHLLMCIAEVTNPSQQEWRENLGQIPVWSILTALTHYRVLPT